MPAHSSRFSLGTITLAGLFTILSGPAWAQNAPVVTISGGFTSVVEGDLQMPGFYVEGERRLTRLISAVGQVHRATGTGSGYFSNIYWTDLFVGGGVRVSGRPTPWFQPYGQLLVGPYQVQTVETALPSRFGGDRGTSGSYTDTTIATVAGGGVTLMPTPHFGFRAGVDLQFFPGALPNARVVLGVVAPIGRK